jgi:hypothetical protein
MVPPSFDGRGERKRCTISQSGLQRNSTAGKLQDMARWHRGLYCWKTARCGAAMCKVWCCNVQGVVLQCASGRRGKRERSGKPNNKSCISFYCIVGLLLSSLLSLVCCRSCCHFVYSHSNHCIIQISRSRKTHNNQPRTHNTLTIPTFYGKFEL